MEDYETQDNNKINLYKKIFCYFNATVLSCIL